MVHMPSVILTLQEAQALIKAETHLSDLETAYKDLSAKYDALRGLYSDLLMKVADLEKLI